MNIKSIALIALFFQFTFVVAEENSPISLQFTRSEMLESDPGKIVSFGVIAKNKSSKRQSCQIDLKIPQGWQSIPQFSAPFNLNSYEEKSFVFAIKIPNSASPSVHPLFCQLQSTDEEGKSSEVIQKLDIQVLSRNEIAGRFTSVPNYVIKNQDYEVEFELKNLGNGVNHFTIEASDPENELEESDTIQNVVLESGQSTFLKFHLKPRKKSDYHRENSLKLVIVNQESENKEIFITPNIKLFASRTKSKKKYRTIPSSLTLGFATEYSQTEAFAEIEGKGYIDTKQQEEVKYFAKAQTNRFTTARELGITPDRIYFSYEGQRFGLFAGDGLFSLTPLTQENRLGRGGRIRLKFPRGKLETLYARDLPDSDMGFKDFGSRAEVDIGDQSHLSAQLLKTLPKNNLSEQFRSFNPQYTTTFFFDKGWNSSKSSHKLALEFGGTNSLTKWENQGGYISLSGEPTASSWYQFKMTTVGQNFIGTYNNSTRISTGIGFPLSKSVRANFNFNDINQLANVNTGRNEASKDLLANGTLNYNLPAKVFGTSSINYQSHSDRKNETGYYTAYLRSSIGKMMDKTTFQADVELGRFKDTSTNTSRNDGRKFYNSNGAYFYYRPISPLTFSFFGRIKTEVQDHFLKWAQSIGSNISWSFYQRQNIQLNVNYSHIKNAKPQLFTSLRGNFQLPRSQKLQFNCQWIKNMAFKNDEDNAGKKDTFRLLLTYTIPFNLPFARNKTKSTLRGKVTRKTQGGVAPLENIVVRCDQQETITNRAGEYSFFDLEAKMHHLWIENEPENYITEQRTPLPVDLAEGKITSQDLHYLMRSEIHGSISLYAFEQSPSKTAILSGKKSHHSLKKQSVPILATVRLESEDKNEIYQIRAKKNGQFTFNNIRPGKWRLFLVGYELPKHHKLRQDVFEFEIFEGDKQEFEFSIIPVERKIRLIQSSHINE